MTLERRRSIARQSDERNNPVKNNPVERKGQSHGVMKAAAFGRR